MAISIIEFRKHKRNEFKNLNSALIQYQHQIGNKMKEKVFIDIQNHVISLENTYDIEIILNEYFLLNKSRMSSENKMEYEALCFWARVYDKHPSRFLNY